MDTGTSCGFAAEGVKAGPAVIGLLPRRQARLGAVHAFDLAGHPQAARCYAWQEPPATEGGNPKVYAVLKVPPISSAADAVRASIVARHRGQA